MDDVSEAAGDDRDNPADHDHPSGVLDGAEVVQYLRSSGADHDTADDHDHTDAHDQAARRDAQRAEDEEQAEPEVDGADHRDLIETGDMHEGLVEGAVDAGPRHCHRADHCDHKTEGSGDDLAGLKRSEMS